MKIRSALLILVLATSSACTNQDFLGKKILQLGSQGPSTNPSPTPAPSQFNARVFYKNPDFVAGSLVGYDIENNTGGAGYVVTPHTPLNLDAYLSPVNITGMTNGFLENADIKVLPASSTSVARAQPDSQGLWNFSTVGDPNHQLGQLMAYYWISQEKQKATSLLPNSWHPTAKSVSIYSYCYDANAGFSSGYNAYWSGLGGNNVCMCYIENLETAYDASLYLHEMGHANVDYATNGAMTQNPTYVACTGTNGICCPTVDGCGPAINEGQADVHSQMVFDSGPVAEFFWNDMNGIKGRNAEKNGSLTVSDMFNGTAINPSTGQPYGAAGKEIHSMGGVWNAAWWTLRSTMGKDDSLKLFLAHLELLQGRDTFKTALQAIIAADQTLVTNRVFTRTHSSEITAAFSQHGIQ